MAGRNPPGGVAVEAVERHRRHDRLQPHHTGKEPYKDPYAFAFGAKGIPLWTSWNPKPALQKAAKFGGDG